MRCVIRHVLTNTIVLLVNCMLLCEQFRQHFVPSVVIYAPLGLKSSYNISYTNTSAPFPVRLCKIIAKAWQNCTNNNFNSFVCCIKAILRHYLFPKSPNKLKNQDSLNLDQRGKPHVFPSILHFSSMQQQHLYLFAV